MFKNKTLVIITMCFSMILMVAACATASAPAPASGNETGLCRPQTSRNQKVLLKKRNRRDDSIFNP